MIHLLVLAVAALHLQDPAGDAVGDGTLAPPTASVYANTADFDLQSVTLTSDPTLTVRVQLGSVSNAAKLPNGFSSPIIEIYLDTAPGGAQQLLPGSGMAMPPKHGWEIALRATGDEAYAVEAQSQGSPAGWPRLPVTVDVQGNAITLHTRISRPARADIYALTGVYDPFAQDGWRPLTSAVSPWAFSSASQQAPVVDLLASNQHAQRREIDSGVLSPYRSPLHGIGWLVLMVLGLVTAAAGLVLRRRVRAPERPGAARAGAAPPDAPGAEAHGQGPGPGDDGRGPNAGVPGEIHERFLDEEEEAALWPDAEASVDRAVAGTDTGPRVADASEGGLGDAPAEDALGDAPAEDAAAEDAAAGGAAIEDAWVEDEAVGRASARADTGFTDTGFTDTGTTDTGPTDTDVGSAGEPDAGETETHDTETDEVETDEIETHETETHETPSKRRP